MGQTRMRVKESSHGGLILDGDILKGAQEAFNDLRYVEAFALIHALIDWWMIDLYQMHEDSKGGLDHVQELHFKRKYRFESLVKDLFRLNIIGRDEYDRLWRFRDLRDKIIHRLLMYAYQPYERNKITKNEATQGFEEGKALAMMLSSRTLKVASNKIRMQ